MKNKKFKLSGKLIFNVAVIVISVYLIIYFCVSENGMIDLLSTPDSFNFWWILAALAVFDLNIVIDSIVTLIFVRSQYKHFRFFDSLKVALVGVFFGAVTPSNTGGQPMQLYLMSKMKIGVGFGSACMTQKFIVYQIVMTAVSIFAVIFRFEYFQDAFTSVWSTLFIIIGFLVQLVMTALFLMVSFSRKITKMLIGLVYKLMKKIKFIKNPEDKIKKLQIEVDMFHKGNKSLFTNAKMLIVTYLLVFLQVLVILSIPYFVYISFDMPSIAIANGQTPATLFDMICIQSFVLFTSNLVPLPGASGGAELAFTLYFGQFFIIGAINKIKPAILLWRFITYYGAIIISAPFSYFTKGKKADDEKLKECAEDHVEELEAKNKENIKA